MCIQPPRSPIVMEVPSYRVVVLGESGVGKSSLVQRYVFNVYSEGGPRSGREEETKTIKFKTGQQVQLRICDTQGKAILLEQV